MRYDVKLEVNSMSLLGEGPFWHHDKRLLYWVDIEGKLFHIYNPKTGENTTYKSPMIISAVVSSTKHGFIVAAENGFYRYIPEDNTIQELVIINDI